MYGEDEYSRQLLYYDEYGQNRRPDPDANVFAPPRFHDAPSQNVRHIHPPTTHLRPPIGLGPPPSCVLRAVPAMILVEYNACSIVRATGSGSFNPFPQAPTADRGLPSRGPSLHLPPDMLPPAVPDVGTMLAALSLQQNTLMEQNEALAKQNAALQARLTSLENQQHAQPETATSNIPQDARAAAASKKKAETRVRKSRQGGQRLPQGDEPTMGALYLGAKDLSPDLAAAKRATQVRRSCGSSSAFY
jgi:hypothetical protein